MRVRYDSIVNLVMRQKVRRTLECYIEGEITLGLSVKHPPPIKKSLQVSGHKICGLLPPGAESSLFGDEAEPAEPKMCWSRHPFHVPNNLYLTPWH